MKKNFKFSGKLPKTDQKSQKLHKNFPKTTLKNSDAYFGFDFRFSDIKITIFEKKYEFSFYKFRERFLEPGYF